LHSPRSSFLHAAVVPGDPMRRRLQFRAQPENL
jgi:hypothetical protein